MKFVMIKCLDCHGFTFAIESKENNWITNEEYNEKVSEFCCPSCGNQLWEETSDIVGEFEYKV